MNPSKSVFSWSSGKDSAMALHACLENRVYDIKYLLTTVSRRYQRVSQHGISIDLLEKQAQSIGIPLKKVWLPEQLDMKTYSKVMLNTWKELKEEDISKALFGDIYLENIREYRQKQLRKEGITAEFPLWQHNTKALSNRFIELGFKAIVVSVSNRWLDESFAGRLYDSEFLSDLPSHTDPCGENGEFHTFVYEGPIFNKSISWEKGEVVFKNTPKEGHSGDQKSISICSNSYDNQKDEGIWFCELKAVEKE